MVTLGLRAARNLGPCAAVWILLQPATMVEGGVCLMVLTASLVTYW